MPDLDAAALDLLLPYGRAFRFVDHISIAGDVALGGYRVPEQADWLAAHFRHCPVMPGVLLTEGMAQTATAAVRLRHPDPATIDLLALSVEAARFSHSVPPGSALRYRIELGAGDARIQRFRAHATVGDRQVAELRAILVIVPRLKATA
jgi:3-hydroxyacyl-[acyl-carrier-protein] dehydratase